MDCKEIKQVNPKGNHEYSVEGLMLKLQYFGHLFLGKDPDVGKDLRWEEKGMIENDMVGWHH